jgi:hypothetical protein
VRSLKDEFVGHPVSGPLLRAIGTPGVVRSGYTAAACLVSPRVIARPPAHVEHLLTWRTRQDSDGSEWIACDYEPGELPRLARSEQMTYATLIITTVQSLPPGSSTRSRPVRFSPFRYSDASVFAQTPIETAMARIRLSPEHGDPDR